jgi:hypothetical protein
MGQEIRGEEEKIAPKRSAAEKSGAMGVREVGRSGALLPGLGVEENLNRLLFTNTLNLKILPPQRDSGRF